MLVRSLFFVGTWHLSPVRIISLKSRRALQEGRQGRLSPGKGKGHLGPRMCASAQGEIMSDLVSHLEHNIKKRSCKKRWPEKSRTKQNKAE